MRYPIGIQVEIMCTLTPVQVMGGNLAASMYAAGMRAVRINTAHLTGVEQLQQMATVIKSIDPKIRILIDTKGPEVRTTALLDDIDIHLNVGDKTVLEGSSSDLRSSTGKIYVNYPMIHTEVEKGDILLIDDGKIRLKVDDVTGPLISNTVKEGGILGSRKGVAVLGKDLNLPAVNQHDQTYIEYAAGSDLIDVIAHSFVRCKADVQAVKLAMGSHRKPIIAKIENQQGIDNIDDIVEVADGILIARGDLTASIGKEAIPAAQAFIAGKAKEAGRPLYLATNILPSMMHAAHPSGTDLEGIAIALRQGVDVMLLTNETATGAHPVDTVEVLYQAIKNIQS